MKKLSIVVFSACFLLIAFSSFAADIELAKKSTINTVLSRGELRVGFDSGTPPFEMEDKNGNYIGFDIDLARELSRAMGVKFVPVDIDFNEIIPALLTGKIDVIIGALSITQERNLKIGFSEPYFIVGQSVLLNKKLEGKITLWSQLNNLEYTVLSQKGTTGEEAAKRYLGNANLKTVEGDAGAFEVVNDRADAWVFDMPFNVVFYAEHGKGKVVHLDQPFTYEPLGIGISQGDPDFMNFINNFLRQFKGDGRYERLYEKWVTRTDWFERIRR
ncbi:MAG: transporter substrate-binding domain-containing protein [Desulfovibrio sp.]|nr:transporter substrate-binding domain-containing protein [Desulfovibrio sp.]